MKELPCPDCKEQLLSPFACECGWRQCKRKRSQCAYQFEGRQCLLEGTSSNSLGRHALLYCSYHIHHTIYPEEAQAALHDMFSDWENFWKKHVESRRSRQELEHEERLQKYSAENSGQPFDYKKALQAFLNRYKF